MLTWTQLRSSFKGNPTAYWEHCQSLGLDCPQDVFIQLFYGKAGSGTLVSMTHSVDWSNIRWSLEVQPGSELRLVHVDPYLERAVDEVYSKCLQFGLSDERLVVRRGWELEQTWIAPPVLVSGHVFGTKHRHVLLVGNSRLGNLWGLLDRGEMDPSLPHRVWIGRPATLAGQGEATP